MNIFKIFILQRNLRSGKMKPSDAMVEEILDFMKGYLWLIFFIFSPLLAISGVFAFSGFLNGPYSAAEFFFWFFFIIFALVLLAGHFIYRKLKKLILRTQSSFIRYDREVEGQDLPLRR